MSEQENTQTARGAYEAFGKGDLPAVLGVMSDDIEWVFPGPADVVPMAGTRHGKHEVAAWFATLDANVEFQAFEPREFIAQGDRVVSLVHIETTVRRNGEKITADELHLWTFRDGKVAASRPTTTPRRRLRPSGQVNGCSDVGSVRGGEARNDDRAGRPVPRA